jgi:hypothetical protein
MRSGADINFNLTLLTESYDDLISRGHGLVRFSKRLSGMVSYTTPRRGTLRKSVSLNIAQEGYDGLGETLNANATLYPHKNFTVDLRLSPYWSNDWLIWLNGDWFASHTLRQITAAISPTWFPAEHHEIPPANPVDRDEGRCKTGLSYRFPEAGWFLPVMKSMISGCLISV